MLGKEENQAGWIIYYGLSKLTEIGTSAKIMIYYHARVNFGSNYDDDYINLGNVGHSS